jgi:hypothetical protein
MIITIKIKYNNMSLINELLTYIKLFHNIDISIKKNNIVQINNIIFIFMFSTKNELTFIYKSENILSNGSWNINELSFLPRRLQNITIFYN